MHKSAEVGEVRTKQRILHALLLLAAAGLLGAAAADNFVFVVLNTAAVQEKPAYFSKKIADVKEGDRLQLTGTQGVFGAVVLPDGRTGYVQQTAIMTREKNRDWSKVLGRPDSARDTYAAGKGFGPEVEAQYKKDTQLDFGPVDRMIAKPTYVDPAAQLEPFRREGKLGEFAEGR